MRTSNLLPDLYRQGERIEIKDVTSQSLGVIAVRGDDDLEFNSIIVSRNSKIPATGSSTYVTRYDNQEEITIQITEGDDEDPDYVTILGACPIPLPRYPKGAAIRVDLAYDVDQTVFVQVHDMTGGKLAGSFQVDRVANLSDEELARSLARLKTITVA